MELMMKKVCLYVKKITLATALVSVVDISAGDTESRSFNGLHLGVGVNFAIDKYETHVTTARPSNHQVKTVKLAQAANSVDSVTENNANNLISGLWNAQEGEYAGENNLKIGNRVIASNGNGDYNEISGLTDHEKKPLTLYTDAPQNNYAQYADNAGKTVKATKYNGDIFVGNALEATDDFSKLWHDSNNTNTAKVNGKEYSVMSFYTGEGQDQANAKTNLYSTSNAVGAGQELTLYHEGPNSDQKTQFDKNSSYIIVAEQFAGGIFHEDKQVNGDLFYKSTADETRIGDDIYNKMTFYTKTDAVDRSQISVSTANASYLLGQSLSKRKTGIGGEFKIAYFWNFDDNLIAGVDLTGVISSKNKSTVKAIRFDVTENPELLLTGKDGRKIATASGDGINSIAVENAKIEKDEELTLSNLYSYKTANPATTIVLDNSYQDKSINVSNGSKDVVFEKGTFSPRLAVVAGITFGSWFTGVRAGVSHMTGKVKTVDMTDYSKVAITSPFIGLHVMKQFSDNMHMYITADLNVGEGTKNINKSGINSFKQTGYNISAGFTWRVKI